MTQSSQPLISHKTALWFGFAGILGSIILFAGDMLFYYNGEQTDLIANMAVASNDRIIASGISALLAAWLYTLGAGQLYYAFQPTKKWIRLAVFFAFAAVMITYGVVHGAYVAIATSAIIANQLGLSPDELTKLSIEANDALRLLAYPPFAIFTFLFIPMVWKKATHYPRWVILFTPAIPFLFSGPVYEALDGSMKTIIAGGYLNLILFFFFTTSTIALWRDPSSK